jgi:hypothetical protein
MTNTAALRTTNTAGQQGSTGIIDASQMKTFEPAPTFSPTPYIVLVISLLIGSYLLPRHFQTRSQRNKAVDDLKKAFDALKSTCIEYWSVSVTKDNRVEIQTTEQKLKAELKSLDRQVQDLCKTPQHKTEVQKFMVDVMDACTGGKFEAARRPADSTRCEWVGRAIDAVRSAISDKNF